VHSMTNDPYGWTGIGWYGAQLGTVFPSELEIPVLLVKAQEFIPEINVEHIPALMADDFGWRRYYSNLSILECNGDHFTMLMEPHVSQWPNAMMEWIKKHFE